jgi:hypothetical protein
LPHTPEKLIKNIVDAGYYGQVYEKITNNQLRKTPELFIKLLEDSLMDKTQVDFNNNNEVMKSVIEILASFLIGDNCFGASVSESYFNRHEQLWYSAP